MMRWPWIPALLFTVSACGGEPPSSDGGTGMVPATTLTADDVDGADATGGDCPEPLLACADACIDPQHDPQHCGGCDQACSMGLACVEGSCQPACGPGLITCGDACIDPQLDPAHCGACGFACAPEASCVEGACVASCEAPAIDCEGTCRTVTNDEQHCGGCNTPCPGEQPCVQGQCVATTLHHVLITGQSLSVGSLSAVVSTEQPYDNVSFVTGVRAGAAGLDSLIPLVETASGSLGETLASGMANLITERRMAAGVAVHRSLMSAHGVGGQPYSALQKGTAPYAAGMAQVAAGMALAQAQGEDYAVRAVVSIHGETDHLGGNASYDLDLLEWQSDYDADIRAMTGQALEVPLLTDQMSSFTALGTATSMIPQLQLEASRAQPERVVLMGPKYVLPYVPDGVHLTGDGERWLGEMHAKVFDHVLVHGEVWRPVSPRSIVREGAQITVRMWVPVPPLVLDQVQVADPGNYGFEFTDNSGAPPSITRVALATDDTVLITLSDVPVGGNERIRYAMTGTAGQPAGPMTGARGNLRDSDASASPHGYSLHNWCVHFDEPVEH